MKKDVIKDNRTGKIYFDTGIVRNFETVLTENKTIEAAKKMYPSIIEI